MSAAERASKASSVEQANERTDERVTQYFSPYSWLFWPTVYIVKTTDSSGNTPLHMAALSGSVSACEVLLKHQADPNARNAAGESPLHQAIKSTSSKERAPLLQLLVEWNSDLKIADKDGKTALLSAIRLKKPGLITELVRLGAKTDGLKMELFDPYIRRAITDGTNLISE